MTQAKAAAFLQGIESGKFDDNRAKVYLLLQHKPCTINQACLYYGFTSDNQLSGRFTELYDMGLIKPYGDDISVYTIVYDKEEQHLIRLARSEQKRQIWLKKGRDNNWI